MFAQGVGRVRAGVAISAGEKNLRTVQHNFVEAVVLSVSLERPAWSLPLRKERFQHLDNEKKVFSEGNAVKCFFSHEALAFFKLLATLFIIKIPP